MLIKLHNKIEYCLGNWFELLLSASEFVSAVCQDSSVFLTRNFPLSIGKMVFKLQLNKIINGRTSQDRHKL